MQKCGDDRSVVGTVSIGVGTLAARTLLVLPAIKRQLLGSAKVFSVLRYKRASVNQAILTGA